MSKKKNPEPVKNAPAPDEDDASSTQPTVPPAAASSEPAEAAPPAPPAPLAPAGAATKNLRYRVVSGRVVSLHGQIQSIAAGTIVAEDGYGGAAGIQHLRDAGLDLELCE
jgi:hypothetical protein